MKKTKIFLTGATGNVGKSILSQIDFTRFSVTAAVRNIEKAQREKEWDKLTYVQFDFEEHIGFDGIENHDIASVCVHLFENYEQYKDKILTLTNTSNHGFSEIVSIINNICETEIRYESPNVLSYVLYMRRHTYSFGYIGIMLLLHFLPRFEREPEIHDDVIKILGRNPIQISRFIEKNKSTFER